MLFDSDFQTVDTGIRIMDAPVLSVTKSHHRDGGKAIKIWEGCGESMCVAKPDMERDGG